MENECRKIIPKEEETNIGPAFNSGEELIEYMKDNHVDVVLLDIDMPNMNGFEVARYICKEHNDVKIVFMSAYDNFVYSAFEFYPFAYLRKTHISDELSKVLKRIWEKMSEPERQLKLITTEGIKMVDLNSILSFSSPNSPIGTSSDSSVELFCIDVDACSGVTSSKTRWLLLLSFILIAFTNRSISSPGCNLFCASLGL